MLSITGKSVATVAQMRTYIEQKNPNIASKVTEMIPYYLSEGNAENIRGDIAFAQSCLETGNFTFRGSAVTLDQNNFAGIGVTKTGEKGNSWDTAQLGIRAQIQHLKAYANNEDLVQECVDPRFKYVARGCAPYVEYLGIQENPQKKGWASGANYGSKIINILNAILAIEVEEDINKETENVEKGVDESMEIKTTYISNNNSYANQTPVYIAIHNTDNFSSGANAKAHAKAQYNGNFSGYSAHVYVDDAEAYQATPYNRGCWHVGVNYGGKLFGTVNNRNSIGIEMCVQKGYDYEKAFLNTVDVCKQLMKKYNIPVSRVVSHYDVCNKNCPSQIRAKGDWDRFKTLISGETTTTTTTEKVVDKYYRIRKSWKDSKSQIGAYKSLENAKRDWKEGYIIFDWNGKQVYPEAEKAKTKCSMVSVEEDLPLVQTGCTGVGVKVLQTILGTNVTGTFSKDDANVLAVFQKNVEIDDDGICGKDSWTKLIQHIASNTYKN